MPEVATPDELFKQITGCDYEEKKALLELQESFKIKPHLVDKPGIEFKFDFNAGWEQSKKDLENKTHVIEPPMA